MGIFEHLLGHVIDLEFDTHEAMIEAALQWQLEEYQLDSGSFRGSIYAIHTSHIQIASTSRSNGVFVKGNTPKNTYMFASVESQGNITHNGLTIFEDELVVLHEDDQLDFIASSTVNDVTVAIDKDFFDNAFEKKFNEAFSYDSTNKRIQLKENTASVFRAAVKETVFDLISKNQKLQSDIDFNTKSEHAILQLIFDTIDLAKQRKSVLESEINADKIRKYIEKNYDNNISINEFCSTHNISERTLRLGFRNLFGLSPKQYHKAYCLGKVHHSLLKADHAGYTVENIAYNHGFTHMGRFSKNYKSMFGNTPSYTLKKNSL